MNADQAFQQAFLQELSMSKIYTDETVRGSGTSVINPVEHVNQKYGIEDTPVGHIISHMGTKAPKHYLACDGAEYLIADYPRLAQHFANDFGSVNFFGGDGETTFTVPDLRGEFLRGTGTASRKTGAGAEVGVHQDGTFHLGVRVNQSNDVFIGGKINTAAGPGNCDTIIQDGNARYFRISQILQASDTKTYTSRPTNTAVMFCIKCRPTYFMSTQAIYSYEERPVGIWVDGKTLYEKTINFGVLPNDRTDSIPHKIEHVDEIWIYDGHVKDLASGLSLPVNHSHTEYTKNSWNCSVDNTSIGFTTGTDRSGFSAVVTVRYTKAD